jgi:hypothetical protein
MVSGRPFSFGYFHLHLYKLENEGKQITLDDGLLDKLEHSAVVMADRGLLIADEVYHSSLWHLLK